MDIKKFKERLSPAAKERMVAVGTIEGEQKVRPYDKVAAESLTVEAVCTMIRLYQQFKNEVEGQESYMHIWRKINTHMKLRYGIELNLQAMTALDELFKYENWTWLGVLNTLMCLENVRKV